MSTDFDYERAAQMMNIMQQVANIAPKATSILGLAQRELNELNDKAKEIAVELAAKDKHEAAAATEATKAAAPPIEPAAPPAADDASPTIADRRL